MNAKEFKKYSLKCIFNKAQGPIILTAIFIAVTFSKRHVVFVSKSSKNASNKNRNTDLRVQTWRLPLGNQRIPDRVLRLAMCRDELSRVIGWLMSKSL